MWRWYFSAEFGLIHTLWKSVRVRAEWTVHFPCFTDCDHQRAVLLLNCSFLKHFLTVLIRFKAVLTCYFLFCRLFVSNVRFGFLESIFNIILIRKQLKMKLSFQLIYVLPKLPGLTEHITEI